MLDMVLRNGVDPKTAMDRVGHASLDLTMEVYGTINEEQDRAAAEAVGAALFSGQPGTSGQVEKTGT